MNKFTIAIIQPNKIKYEKKFLENCSKEQLTKDILKYTEFVEVTNNTYMEVIIDKIKLTPKLIGGTESCYEDHEYAYQLCHISREHVPTGRHKGCCKADLQNHTNNNETDTNEINGLSSYLSINNLEIYGVSVFLKSKIEENNTCTQNSVTVEDVTNVLYHNLVHTGLKIYTNGTIEEFNFIEDPLEDLETEETNNLKWLSVNVLNFNFIMFIQMKPDPDKINKTMTLIKGDAHIHGDIYLALKSTEVTYGSIDKCTLDKLLRVLSNTLASRKLLDNEKVDRKKEDNKLPLVMNKYCILEKRYKDYEMKCHNCKNKLNGNNKKVCTGCHRIIYCSRECQRDNWGTHEKECLYKQISLNSKL